MRRKAQVSGDEDDEESEQTNYYYWWRVFFSYFMFVKWAEQLKYQVADARRLTVCVKNESQKRFFSKVKRDGSEEQEAETNRQEDEDGWKEVAVCLPLSRLATSSILANHCPYFSRPSFACPFMQMFIYRIFISLFLFSFFHYHFLVLAVHVFAPLTADSLHFLKQDLCFFFFFILPKKYALTSFPSLSGQVYLSVAVSKAS